MESKVFFKFDPRQSTEEGIVAIGGKLNVDFLCNAYSTGVFPWPQEGLPMLWFSPKERGILKFSQLKINRTLKKFLKKTNIYLFFAGQFYLHNRENKIGIEDLFLPVPVTHLKDCKKLWVVTINHHFDQVISECQKQKRPGQEGTWISEEVLNAYREMAILGHAYSAEVWDCELNHSSNFISSSVGFEDGFKKELIGGVYGVKSELYYSGESMFYKKSFASKVALLGAMFWIFQNGFDWMDIQMVTEASESLGGFYVDREVFLKMIHV